MNNDVLNIIFRTILVLVILFALAKIMGKKQVSQLNLFDYIIGITMGSIAADISLDIEKDIISGLCSLTIYALASVGISYLTIKSILLRRIFTGVPTIVMENNKIISSGLKKAKIDINDLLEEARNSGYFNLEEINTAIMETNGKISFQPKEQEKTVTKKDMNIKTTEKNLTANIIIDRKLLTENLRQMNKTEDWLNRKLKIEGHKNYDNILLATLDTNDKLVVYTKNISANKPSILE